MPATPKSAPERRTVIDALRDLLRVQLRLILPVGLVVLIGVVVVGLLVGLYAVILGRVAYLQLVAWASSQETASLATVIIIVPMLLLCAVASLVWAGIAVQLANAAATKRRISTGSAALSSLRQMPRAAAVAVFVPLVFVLAVVATPVLVVLGLVGLALKRARERWSTSSLIILAVPLGAAVYLLLRWSLALPSIWLAKTSIRGALADSAERTRGRKPALAIVLALAAITSVVVTEGLVAIVTAFELGVFAEAGTRLVAIIAVGTLLPVALALQYREGGDVPSAPPAVKASVSRRTRVAVAVITSLVIPLVVSSNPAPAAAAGTEEVTFSANVEEAQPLPSTTASTLTFSVSNAHNAEVLPPTGTFSFTIDGANPQGPFPLTPRGLDRVPFTFTPGTHVIDATYSGDTTYEAKTATLTVVVAAPPVDNVITDSWLEITGSTVAGSVLTGTVDVTARTGTAKPEGSVQLVRDGDATPLATGALVNGTVSLNFSLPPGTNYVYAYYTPATGFAASNHARHFVVAPYPSSVALTSSGSSTVFGQLVDFTATVTPTGPYSPTGSVRFEATPDGGTAFELGTESVTSGAAVLSTAALAVGDYEVVAYYLGDTASAASTSADLGHSVGTSTSAVTVTPSFVNPAFGSTISITVAVAAAGAGSGTPGGTAVVYRDGDEVGTVTLNSSGVGTLSSVSVGAGGSRVFSAQYSGNSSFSSSSGSATVTVAPEESETHLFDPLVSSTTYGASNTYAGSVSADTGVPAGTVTIYVGGTIVGSATLSGTGSFSLTTTSSPAGTNQSVWAVYNGDADHGSSDSRATTPGKTVTVAKVASSPVVSVTPGSHTVGETVTLTATLSSLGVGPTGTVTFKSNATVLGTATITGSTATLSYVIRTISTPITVEYGGNANFTAGTSSTLTITAGKATPTVTMGAILPHTLGEAFSLAASVTLPGGVAANGTVDFLSSEGYTIGSATVVSGVAILPVCAGNLAQCPTGARMGVTTMDVTARYNATAINVEAVSTAVSYVMARWATVTTLSVNPDPVRPNSGIALTATVDAVDYLPAPTGSIDFYGLEPNSFGGVSEYFLVNVPLYNGVAYTIAETGTDLTELRWPAEGVRARYVPALGFASSYGDDTVTVDRYSTSLSVWASAPSIVGPTTIQIGFNDEVGTSAPHTGLVTVTADNSTSCTVPRPMTTRVVSCDITWNTAGVHTVSVSYAGDLVYEPASSGVIAIGFGAGTPSLAPVLSSGPVAEFDSTVYWQLFNSSATGTVTVWADGALWCSVPIGDRQCTGQFATWSATGSPVDVVVRYSGDANWRPSEDVLSATVKRCVVPLVRSNDNSLGTVSMTTPSNCGVGGYLSGTQVTAQANPIAPNVFVDWKKPGGLNNVFDTRLPNVSWRITTDFMTWERLATFTTPCYPVTSDITGRGGISVYPATNCTTLGGVAGYRLGTAIAVYPDPQYNPQYSENDAFYFFGHLAGLTQTVDSSNRPLAKATITGAMTIPVTFGPVCRTVSVVFAAPNAADSASLQQAENCQSPQGNGYLRHTAVTVKAVPGSPSAIVSGWLLNGVPQSGWGAAAEQTIVVGAVAPVLTVQTVNCYLLDITVDGAEAVASRKQVGKVNTDVATNCPDGSQRYLEGTVVTLTPEILVDNAAFTGWDSTRLPNSATQKGVLTNRQLSFAMTANFAVTANFFFGDSCSPLNVYVRPGIIAFEDDGCGLGQYFDETKQTLLRDPGLDPAKADKYRTELVAEINPNLLTDVYVSVQGDVLDCFGNSSAGGAPTVIDGWTTYGPLTGRETCKVTGPIKIDVETCQRFDATPQFTTEYSQERFSLSAIPSQLYLPDPYGMVGPFDLNQFDWMQSGTVGTDSAGKLTVSNLGADPCTRSAANTYPESRNLALYAYGPTAGFVAAGFVNPKTGAVDPQNPVVTATNGLAAVRTVTPVYELTCHRLMLGRGITVIGSPARCPGSDPADNWFVAGTAVQVRAATVADDRDLHGYLTGVVAKQIVEESESSKALLGFVIVDADKRVEGDYPTKTEAVARALVQNLKVVVGVLAIMAPIALGMLFPPAGMFFAFLGAMAGIANMIPHGGEVAAVLDLVNPTKITTCAARWGFTNSGDPTGGYGVGGMISGANTLRKVWQGKDVIFEKVGPLGLAGGAASLAYGLYEAGAGNVDHSPQTVEELAGTSTMTGCLDAQWRAAGSNISGN